MRALAGVMTALVLVAGVAGCSTGDAEPAPPATSSPSSTIEAPTASPTTPVVARPVLPAAATTPDAAGAEAFVRFFWDTVNYAYATGDTQAILDISDPGCVGCIGLKDGVETATSVGWEWRNFAWSTEQYAAATPDEADLSLVSGLMRLSDDPHIVGPAGQRGVVEGPRVKTFVALAQWQEGKWLAFAIEYPDDDL